MSKLRWGTLGLRAKTAYKLVYAAQKYGLILKTEGAHYDYECVY